MFARISLLVIAVALVFGSIHAGTGLVEHHDGHDSASLAFNHHHDSNMSSAKQDIAISHGSSERDDDSGTDGDMHQHFSPSADRVSGSKFDTVYFDGRSLVFADAPAFMRSVKQKPPIEPPLA